MLLLAQSLGFAVGTGVYPLHAILGGHGNLLGRDDALLQLAGQLKAFLGGRPSAERESSAGIMARRLVLWRSAPAGRAAALLPHGRGRGNR